MSLTKQERRERRASFRHYKSAKACKGKLIEVGLGHGVIADLLVERTDFTSLTSYERDSTRVRDYSIKHQNHTIVEADFITDTATSKFDVAILDVFNGYRPAVMKNARDIVTRLKSRLNAGGRIIIQFNSDKPEERRFKKFMKDDFGELQKEHINTGNRATSKHIWYYEI